MMQINELSEEAKRELSLNISNVVVDNYAYEIGQAVDDFISDVEGEAEEAGVELPADKLKAVQEEMEEAMNDAWNQCAEKAADKLLDIDWNGQFTIAERIERHFSAASMCARAAMTESEIQITNAAVEKAGEEVRDEVWKTMRKAEDAIAWILEGAKVELLDWLMADDDDPEAESDE